MTKFTSIGYADIFIDSNEMYGKRNFPDNRRLPCQFTILLQIQIYAKSVYAVYYIT